MPYRFIFIISMKVHMYIVFTSKGQCLFLYIIVLSGLYLPQFQCQMYTIFNFNNCSNSNNKSEFQIVSYKLYKTIVQSTTLRSCS